MSRSIKDYEDRLQAGERLQTEDMRWLWQNADDDDLRSLASIVRGRFHMPGAATYVLMRIINYTNICVAKCDYCSFYRLPGSQDGYVRSNEWIFQKIDELIAAGGDFFGFNGGHNPGLKIDYYLDLFSSIRNRYAEQIEFYALTIVELIYIAKLSNLTIRQAAALLKDAGVRWITGGGAEILVDTFRMRHSPLKYTVDEYYNALSDILEAGLNSTATMVIGFDETIDERLDHIERLRRFQDSTGGRLFSFLCWTYKPYNNTFGGAEISARDYLRHLALCRIYLDNFRHIRTSVLTQNANALKGLQFGADDFDVPWEDEVTEMAGAVVERDVERVLGYALEAGFKPTRRKIAGCASPGNKTALQKN